MSSLDVHFIDRAHVFVCTAPAPRFEATFSDDMNLERFPLDRQLFRLHILHWSHCLTLLAACHFQRYAILIVFNFFDIGLISLIFCCALSAVSLEVETWVAGNGLKCFWIVVLS